MSLSANVNFYFQLTKSGAGVTGKAASITATIKKVTRGSSPTITTVTTSGGVVVGSVSEVDATNNKGAYVIGVTGLDPSADYLAGAHYTGTSTDVDNVDLPSYQAEFSLSISAGAIPQVQSDADGGLPTIRTVSKIVHGTKCWYVQTSANGGSDSNAGTAAAPFLTLAHACSAAAAGDTILVGGGSFSEVDFTVPANARLIGAGMGVTIVTSTSNNDTICRVSSGSMVSDMTIKGTAGSGIFQYAVGDNGATVTDVLIVRISGGTDSDFKYFTGTGSTYRAIECEGTGHWDESYEGGTGIIGEEWRCTYRSTGPNTEAANNGSVITVGGQNNVLRLFDPKIIYTDTASNTSRTVEAVRAIDGGNANANNRIEIYRGSISTNVPDGTIRHFRADDGCTVTVQDTSFDPSKVAQHFAIYGGPTGGTYSITVANYAGSQTAAGIAYNANDATIQAALAALSNVGAGNVTVSGKFITFTPAVGAVSLSVAGSFTGGTSPAIYIGNVLIQNTPINQAAQIAPGALASGALMPATFTTGVYPMQVGPDFTNIKQATGATTFNNVTIPTVTNVTNAIVLPSIPANWITAAGINAAALDGKGDWLLSSSYTAPDNADIATLAANYTASRAAKLDDLDAAVSSRLAASSYVAPDNADIVTSLADLVTLLARTDPTTNLAAVKAVTDKLNTMLATSGLNYTFTVDALKNAPAGGGGGGNTNLNVSSTEVRTQ